MSQLLLPVAPEGRKSIAQGVSPGVPKPETLSPEGAEEPEGGMLSPLRGSMRAALDFPWLARRGLYPHAPPGLRALFRIKSNGARGAPYDWLCIFIARRWITSAIRSRILLFCREVKVRAGRGPLIRKSLLTSDLIGSYGFG